jgi:hypothetical protein
MVYAGFLLGAGSFLYRVMNFSKLIADDTGAPSVMRLVFLFVILAVVTVWAVLSIRAGAFVPMPVGVLELIGILTGGKVAQSFSENFSPANTITQTKTP